MSLESSTFEEKFLFPSNITDKDAQWLKEYILEHYDYCFTTPESKDRAIEIFRELKSLDNEALQAKMNEQYPYTDMDLFHQRIEGGLVKGVLVRLLVKELIERGLRN